MSTVFNVDFSGDPNTAAGGPGTTTGAGHGIADCAGGMLSRNGGKLVATWAAAGGGNYGVGSFTAWGTIGASGTELDQQIAVFLPASRSANANFTLGARCDPFNGILFHGYWFIWAPNIGLYGIGKVDAGAGSGLVTGGGLSFPGYSDSTAYWVTASAIGTNPTTLTFRFLSASTVDPMNPTPGEILAEVITTDGEAILQALGPMSVAASPNSGSAEFSIVRVDESSGIPALEVPFPTLVSRSSGQNVLSVSPSGGTPTYTQQWHRKENSVNWTPGVGTLISGATGTTLTDNDVSPGEIWVYKCVVTDAGAQVTTSPYALVEALMSEPMPPPVTLTSDGVILVMMGDSITAAAYWQTAMLARLEELGIPTDQVHLTVQGHPGSTLFESWDPEFDPYDHWADAIEAVDALKDTYPTALVVWSEFLGTNDGNTTTAEMYQEVQQKISDFIAARGETLVVHQLHYLRSTVQNIDLHLEYRTSVFNATGYYIGDRHLLHDFHWNQGTYYGVPDPDSIHPDATHGGPAMGVNFANGLRLTALAGEEAAEGGLGDSGEVSIEFPTHSHLNPDGQFSQLVKNGDRWSLYCPETKQSKDLTDRDLVLALQAILQPIMS